MFARSIPPTVAEAQKVLAAEPPDRKSARREVEQLWDAAQRLGVSEAGPDATAVARAAIHLEALKRALKLIGAADLSGLSLPEAEVPLVQQALTEGLGPTPPVDAIARAHANAATKLNAEDRLVGDWFLKRVVRIGVGLALGAAVAVAVATGVGKLLEPADLAKGHPFKTSSKMADCHPEQNECAGFPTKILFHTLEEPNPWYVVDLEAPTQFSRLTIVNRGDSGEARAVPLVVELSDDGTTFREVARRQEVFSTWKPELGPQTARYVRVRVDRTSWLHLEAVRVHR